MAGMSLARFERGDDTSVWVTGRGGGPALVCVAGCEGTRSVLMGGVRAAGVGAAGGRGSRTQQTTAAVSV